MIYLYLTIIVGTKLIRASSSSYICWLLLAFVSCYCHHNGGENWKYFQTPSYRCHMTEPFKLTVADSRFESSGCFNFLL